MQATIRQTKPFANVGSSNKQAAVRVSLHFTLPPSSVLPIPLPIAFVASHPSDAAKAAQLSTLFYAPISLILHRHSISAPSDTVSPSGDNQHLHQNVAPYTSTQGPSGVGGEELGHGRDDALKGSAELHQPSLAFGPVKGPCKSKAL